MEFRHEMGSFLHEMGSFLEFRIYEPQLFPRPSPGWRTTNGHPVWEQATAAARCLLPLAGSLLADIPPPLERPGSDRGR